MLAGWKSQYFSKGGRLTLLKSTLSSLLTCFMLLFVGRQEIGKLAGFLWGEVREEFKYRLVDWETLCTPIKEEGLEEGGAFDGSA